MLKLTFSTLVALLLLININAQEIDQIKIWQQQHPDVVFVSNDRYYQMSPYERKKIKKREVIFFNDEITIEDLDNYKSKNLKDDVHPRYDTDEAKQWIGLHQEVKIVKQSIYANSSMSIQKEYQQCSYCLILEGEIITLSDISNYELEKH